MMESPEVRALATIPWLFGRQGMALLTLVMLISATFLATDVACLAGAVLLLRMTPRWVAELLVYPRVVPLKHLALPLHPPSLDVASRTSPVADPTRTATVRDYRPDDARRMIHWPTTARRGSLQVRVLEPATSLHVSLLLDVRSFTFGIYRYELLELTLSALASIAVFLQGQGAPIAFLTNTSSPLVVPPGASVPHLQSVLENMARLLPRPGAAVLPWAFEGLPPGNTVVLATSDVAADLERTIAQLEDGGFHVLLLLAMDKTHPG